jgi:hypothetical protein
MTSRVAVLVFLAAAVAVASEGRQVQVLEPAPARPTERQRPAVDPLTASIQGRVVTADSSAPIRRAEVRAMSTSGVNRLGVTDGEGRFELRDMPAGQFRLIVSKSGFVTLTYGQRRPFEASVPIDLKQGQQFTANLALPRAGAIAGRVYDDAGEPLADVRVQALRSRMTEGRRRLEPAGAADTTDDTGSYRLYGLPPGDYYVSASPPRRQLPLPPGAPLTRNVGPLDVLSTMTTFYPGTPSFEDAQRVTLGVGGETRADIQIAPSRAAVVSGIVLTAAGAPAGDATVTLRSEAVAMGVSAIVAGVPALAITGHTNPDGTFVLPGVPPGPYTLTTTVQDFVRPVFDSAGRIVSPPGPPSVPQMASMPIVVSGADMTGLTLATGSGGIAEGTFVADAGVTQPLPRGLEVSARPANGADGTMRMSMGATFRIFGFNGAAHLLVSGLPEGWAVKSMIVDGADMTDQPVDLRNGRNVSVRFVLTDRVTTVTGMVSDGPSREAQERRHHNVVVFPEDSKKWAYPSRYVQTVRTDDQGAFRITALPPGERYLALALDFLEDGEGTDPEFLERLSTRATSFSLGEAERKNVDLRLIQR